MKLETLEEYKNIVGGNKDKLIVVRFYAPWCKVRRALKPTHGLTWYLLLGSDNHCILQFQIVLTRPITFFILTIQACKAIAPAFYRLAATYTNALFIDVPVTAENANLHQG